MDGWPHLMLVWLYLCTDGHINNPVIQNKAINYTFFKTFKVEVTKLS